MAHPIGPIGRTVAAATPQQGCRYRREGDHERIAFRFDLVATADTNVAPQQLMVHRHSHPHRCLIDIPQVRQNRWATLQSSGAGAWLGMHVMYKSILTYQ